MDQLKIIGLDIGRFGNMSHKKPYMKIIMIFAIFGILYVIQLPC